MAIRVVDTDVWSYIFKGRDEGRLYQPHLFGNILVVSFQTQAELIRWAVSAGWSPRRRQHLELRLQKYVVDHSSYALSLRWVEAMESARRKRTANFCGGCVDRCNRVTLKCASHHA